MFVWVVWLVHRQNLMILWSKAKNLVSMGPELKIWFAFFFNRPGSLIGNSFFSAFSTGLFECVYQFGIEVQKHTKSWKVVVPSYSHQAGSYNTTKKSPTAWFEWQCTTEVDEDRGRPYWSYWIWSKWWNSVRWNVYTGKKSMPRLHNWN